MMIMILIFGIISIVAASVTGLVPVLVSKPVSPPIDPPPNVELPLPDRISKELYKQQEEMIYEQIKLKINNIETFSSHLTNIIDESYDQKSYDETKSFKHVIDSLNSTKLFDENTPVPNEVKYFFMIDHNCEYILYAYDNSNLNRSNAKGLEHCDNLVEEPIEKTIITKNYPATALWTFVNTHAQSYDLNKDEKVDFILGISIHWDKIAEEIQNMIFINDDTRYLLVDKENTILIDVTKDRISRLADQADKKIKEGNLRVENKLMMSTETVALKYEKEENHTQTSLNDIVIDDLSLRDWKIITIRSDK